MRSYIPTRDAELLAFVQTFAAGVAARPQAYGLMASDAASISAYVAEFAEAMGRCADPATRTRAAVTDKDGARVSMLTVIRGYAQMIKRNVGVTNEAKIAIGVPVSDAVASPVPAPATHPQLAVLGATPLTHTIRYSDPSSPRARAKPPGAAALLLFKYIGAEPPASPEQALFVGLVTRQPFAVALPAADVGKTAYYFAKWVTRTGLEGPWSAPASMTIAA